jgi:hypothetical protein
MDFANLTEDGKKLMAQILLNASNNKLVTLTDDLSEQIL